jgi:Arc/MetJ-type ribon-helix-helix transcriptional regulator
VKLALESMDKEDLKKLEAYLEGLDELVRSNMYPSRSSAIRSSVRDLLKKELWERQRR